MGRNELLAALQRDGQEKMTAIRERQVAEEERLRAATAERIAALCQVYEQQCAELCSARQRQIRVKAGREAALIRLRAEQALALRLHTCACNLLSPLYQDDAAWLFPLLVAELPNLPWQTLWAMPADTARAAALFPSATIIADAALAGGIKAALAENALSVDNTLETRLEKLWPDLLPQLLADVREGLP